MRALFFQSRETCETYEKDERLGRLNAADFWLQRQTLLLSDTAVTSGDCLASNLLKQESRTIHRASLICIHMLADYPPSRAGMVYCNSNWWSVYFAPTGSRATPAPCAPHEADIYSFSLLIL